MRDQARSVDKSQCDAHRETNRSAGRPWLRVGEHLGIGHGLLNVRQR